MDLLADLKRIVQQQLVILGIAFSNNDDLKVLLLLAINNEMKTISQHPRTVYSSKGFTAKLPTLEAARQPAKDVILAKFENGDEVTSHLSKSPVNPAEPVHPPIGTNCRPDAGAWGEGESSAVHLQCFRPDLTDARLENPKR
jgi:hypothetical protein